MGFRAADLKTGVNYNTISRMASGFVPEMESVVRFARGFGLDVNEWLELAGYPRIESGMRLNEPRAPAYDADPAADYGRAAKQELAALRERMERDGLGEWVTGMGAHHGGSDGLTAEDARAEIAELERVLRKLAGKERG